MALTTGNRNSRRTNAAMTGLLSNPQAVSTALNAIVRLVGNATRQPKSAVVIEPVGGPVSGPRQTKAGRRRARRQDGPTSRQNQSQSRPWTLAPVRSLASDDSVRMRFRDVVGLTNSLLNKVETSYGLCITTDRTQIPLGSVVSRVGVVGALYRKFYLHSVAVRFVPYLSTTNSGSVAIGFDPDPSATTSINNGLVLRFKVSGMCDLMTPMSMTYYSQSEGFREPLYTTNTAATTEPDISFGLLNIVSYNTAASGATVGNLIFDVDVTFMGAT